MPMPRTKLPHLHLRMTVSVSDLIYFVDRVELSNAMALLSPSNVSAMMIYFIEYACIKKVRVHWLWIIIFGLPILSIYLFFFLGPVLQRRGKLDAI